MLELKKYKLIVENGTRLSVVQKRTIEIEAYSLEKARLLAEELGYDVISVSEEN